MPVKTAIFVEGQTELIFVREMLLKMFDYQNIHLECFTLFTEGSFHPTEYAFPNAAADQYFQIINVGMDDSVLSRMIRRKQLMLNNGFHKIIGLRDMYSKQYKDLCQNRKIDLTINQKFIDNHNLQIPEANIWFHFAIMEIEAWVLGMKGIFQKIDSGISSEEIKEKIQMDLEIDPENAYFKPSDNLDKLLKFFGKGGYDKSKGEVNSLVSHMKKSDFIELYNSNRCSSYKDFYKTIFEK